MSVERGQAGDPIVEIHAGRLRGRIVEDAVEFLGVPYAAAPVGARWLAAPEPARPWQGVRDARIYGATAPQPVRPSTLIPEPLIPGHDYLNVNVFAPAAGGARLPGMVWSDGGGYFGGCNPPPWVPRKRFPRARLRRGGVRFPFGLLRVIAA